MLYGLPNIAGKALLGAAGLVVLGTGFNTAAIVAEAVRRAVVQGLDAVRGIHDRLADPRQDKTGVDEWHLRDFIPYSKTPTWSALAVAGLKNMIVGTAALYLLNRFCPSVVACTNNLLYQTLIPVQLAPNNTHMPRLPRL